MLTCQRCGSQLEIGSLFCTNCGASIEVQSAAPETHPPVGAGLNAAALAPPSSAPFSPEDSAPALWQIAGQDASRIAAAACFLLYFGWLLFASDPAATALFLAPALIGSLWPLLRVPRLTAWTEKFALKFHASLTSAKKNTGKFATYFKAPLFSGSLFIWKKTEPVRDVHLRAALRVMALLYFGGMMVALLAMVGYVILVVVVGIAVVLFLLWLLGEMLSNSGGGRVRYTSRITTDWFGRRKEEHYDTSDKKIGESHATTDLLGQPKIEHFDADGEKTGESRPARDWLGSPKLDEHDVAGKKIGESRPTTDLFGDSVTEHFDNSNQKIGESRPDTDIFGNRIVRHTEKDE